MLFCRFAQVDWIVAPFEADAQLAYLVRPPPATRKNNNRSSPRHFFWSILCQAREGLVDAVISEDSDCLPYGCPRTIFKWDGSRGEQVGTGGLPASSRGLGVSLCLVSLRLASP